MLLSRVNGKCQMKFHFGKVPENKEFDPQAQGWIAMKEPSAVAAQFLSLPVVGVVMLVLCWIWSGIIPLKQFYIPIDLLTLVWLTAIIIVHESIHALFHPGYGIGPKTIIGFWPAMLTAYAHFDGPISKRRFITILFAPFAVLSISPLLFCAIFQYQSNAMFAISLSNALLSGCDLFGVVLTFCRIPSDAITQNKGWKTYYKNNQSF